MSIETRYELIFSQERRFADLLADKIVDRPRLSAWMIVIPIIFVQYLLGYRQYKPALEAVAKEFMTTKKAALNAAFDMVERGIPKEQALAGCLPSSEGGYAEPAKEIRRKQLKEIDLLIDHYVKLLKAEGDSYHSLLKNAYLTRISYERFLNLLQQAEKEVNRAANRAFSQTTRNFSEMLSKTEEAAEALRTAEMNTVFPAE